VSIGGDGGEMTYVQVETVGYTSYDNLATKHGYREESGRGIIYSLKTNAAVIKYCTKKYIWMWHKGLIPEGHMVIGSSTLIKDLSLLRQTRQEYLQEHFMTHRELPYEEKQKWRRPEDKGMLYDRKIFKQIAIEMYRDGSPLIMVNGELVYLLITMYEYHRGDMPENHRLRCIDHDFHNTHISNIKLVGTQKSRMLLDKEAEYGSI
jgi:hypothetical protein